MPRCELIVRFEHPAKAVFDALTNPDFLTKWFCERADVDLDAGRYDFWGRYTLGNPKRSRRKLVAWERDALLQYTWRLYNRTTRVELKLTPHDDGGTAVHVNHTGLPEWRWEHGGSPHNFWAGVLGTNLRGWLDRGDAGFRFDFGTPSRGGCELSIDVDASRERVWEVVWDEVGAWQREGRRAGYAMELIDLVPGERVGIPQRGGESEDFTVVTFSLAGSGGRTRLTLVQSGFADPDDNTEAHALGFSSVLSRLKDTAEGRPPALSFTRVVWDTMPVPDGPALLAQAVRGASDEDIDRFAGTVGGHPNLAAMVMAGLRDRLDPREDCAVAFVLADAGEWTITTARRKATLDKGVVASDAVVRMHARDFQRLITRDRSPGELTAQGLMSIEGSGSAVSRLFSMTPGGVPDLVVEKAVAAAPERVWRAVTDELGKWFAEHVDVTPEHFDFWGRHTIDAPARIPHPVQRWVPQRHVRFAWPFRGTDTTVDLELTPQAGGTLVRVRHANVPPRRDGAAMPNFWSFALENLRTWIELGRAAPMPDFSQDCHGGFRIEVDVDAPVERVFDEVHAHQAGGRAVNDRWEIDVGVPIGLELLTLDAPREVRFGWTNQDLTSFVTWTLEGSGGRTRMTVVHSGMDPSYDAAGEMQGWYYSAVIPIKFACERVDSWQWGRPPSGKAVGSTRVPVTP